MSVKIVRVVCVIVLAAFAAGCAERPPFVSGVTTEAKPWTNLDFAGDSRDFRFAVVGDRTGGPRRGVFEKACVGLNILRPDFVISVGDLIRGFTEDRERLVRQWDEFTAMTATLEMPFFYVAGGHDTTNQMMVEYWKGRFGPTYYWFIYKGVLFVALDSYDTPERKAGISREQIDWALKTLAEHADVRWTFLFTHEPIWRGKPGLRAAHREIAAALGDRPHTFFAGHWHRFISYVRNGHEYFIMGTTGGANKLEGPDQGRFDHVAWVTMTDGGPVIGNVLLSGVLPKDVYTEAHGQFCRRFGLVDPEPIAAIPFDTTVSFRPTNPYDRKVSAKLEWSVAPGSGWRVVPPSASIELRSGKSAEVDFKVSFAGDPSKLSPTPQVKIELTMKGKPLRTSRRRPLDGAIKQLSAEASAAASSPADGG